MRRVLIAAGEWLLAHWCRIAAAWEQFWFAPADPVPLGLIRILVGYMLFYTHLVWGKNFQAFFGVRGWMSPETLDVFQRGQWIFSFWRWVPESVMWPVHLMCLCVLSLFAIGLWTRVTSILALIITISYSYRAQFANYGLDQMNAILTFYLAIGPSGAALSVDRLIERFRLARKALSDGKDPPRFEHTPRVTARLALRLMQMHFCVIYFYAGHAKLQGAAWWNGEAMWRAFSNLEYQSIDMTWLAWYPWLCHVMTHATILWEVTFSAGIWVRPLRPLILIMGALMHLGIGAFMGMWTFGLVMIFGHVSFWPPEAVHWLLGRFRRHSICVRTVDREDATSVRRAAWRIAIDFSGHVRMAGDLKADAVLQTPVSSDPSSLVCSPADNWLDPVVMAVCSEKEDERVDLLRAISVTTAEVSSLVGGKTNSSPPHEVRTRRRRCLLCVERDARNQLKLFRYFTARGFRCLLAVEPTDAMELARESIPDAILVLGTLFNDDEIESLHAQYKDSELSMPVLYVLRSGQRQRIGEWLDADQVAILEAKLSLGEMRQRVETMLAQPRTQFLPS